MSAAAESGCLTAMWTPSEERQRRATITRFAREVGVEPGYEALWRWSVDDVEGFWEAIWRFFAVRSDTAPPAALPSRTMPGADWFSGARLSFAEHVFGNHSDAAVAIAASSELRPLQEWTWQELREQTAEIAAGLRALGVQRGDRVVAYMPNIPETIAAFLAASSLGAIWSSAAPEFGGRAVIDRFAQIEPKVLLAVDGYRYGGRDFDRSSTVEEIVQALPTLERVVTFSYLGGEGWPDGFVRSGEALTFERVPFGHPLWVLFSSGTTGLPKALVHSQGGILLEHLKMMHLHLDLQAHDRLLWFTTTGWMMWNFLVGALLTDASIVLYDGNPVSPDPGVLWDLAAETGTTCFGGSPAFYSTCMKAGLEPRRGRDLGALRSVGSSGSPFPPEGFDWVYEHVGDDVWLFSMSGGTDLCTAFIGGVPTLPVYRGQMQARCLGAHVQAFDPEGRPVLGAVGELVITEPMPSMPIGLWNDPDGSKLYDAYFSTYEGIWRHGDWIEITEQGTSVIYGRSDATINRAGVRMGTSEIYSAVLADHDILDALVVDVPRPGAESWMPLFVVLRDGATLDQDKIEGIRRRIRADCSPRHVPNDVYAIEEVPRTLSGKLLEIPVKRILQGLPPSEAASLESTANPQSLYAFERLFEARRLAQ